MYRSTSENIDVANSTPLIFLEGQVTTYVDVEVDNSTKYYYVVTSKFTGTESDASNEVSATPMGYVSLSLSEVSGPYDQGETFDVTVSINNGDNPVAVNPVTSGNGKKKNN